MEDPLKEGMAAHSNILAWGIPWTEEPGGLQSTGSQRTEHDKATEHACTHQEDEIHEVSLHLHKWNIFPLIQMSARLWRPWSFHVQWTAPATMYFRQRLL